MEKLADRATLGSTTSGSIKAALRLSEIGRHGRALELLETAMVEQPEDDALLRAWQEVNRRLRAQLWRQRLWLLVPVALTALLVAVLVVTRRPTEVLLHLKTEGVRFELAEPDLHVDNFFRVLGVTGTSLQAATLAHLDEIEISAGRFEELPGRHFRLRLPSPHMPVDLAGVRATRLEIGARTRGSGAPSQIDVLTEPTPAGVAVTLLARSPAIAGQLEVAGPGFLETGQAAAVVGAPSGRAYPQIRFSPGSQGMDWIEFRRTDGQVQLQFEIAPGAPGLTAQPGEELAVSSVSFVQRQSDRLSLQSMIRGGEVRFPDYRGDPIRLEKGMFVLLDPESRMDLQISLGKDALSVDLRGRLRRLGIGMSPGDASNVVPSTLLWIMERERQAVALYAIGLVLSVIYGFLQRLKLIHVD